jgi:hypothetical protein
MDATAIAFAQQMFRLRIHESNGQKYEDLFVDIMRRGSKSFRPVKPHGSIGDRKNDGFDSDVGAYYQVYSPEDIRRNQGEALKKLQADFGGLVAFWNGLFEVRRFYFVINDRYYGVYPDLYAELVAIEKRHQLEEAKVFLVQDLETRLFALPDHDIFSVIGYVPKIDPADFLFLSGFTCFAHAWIQFERACGHFGYPARIIPNVQTIRELRAKSVISDDEFQFLDRLRSLRNPLFHGDSTKLPAISDIDRLAEITKRLTGLPAQSPVKSSRWGR